MDGSATIEILQSPAALLLASASVIAGLVTVVTALANLMTALNNLLAGAKGLFKGSSPQGHPPLIPPSARRPKIARARKRHVMVGLLLLFAGTATIGARYLTAVPEPVNARLTREAWEALNRRSWIVAIERADECIKRYRGQADVLQTRLASEKAPPPPVGAVTESQKRAIHQNGLLNDVAVSFFIKAQALENMGKKEEALAAYKSAATYTYARAWDPNGWFWSIADAATQSLGSQ